MYGPSGCHPVDLDDVIGQMYKVIHKPGGGGSAIMWLARDLEHHRYLAIKTLRVDSLKRDI